MNDPYRKTIPRREDGTSDIYDVIFAYKVSNPAVEHAIKKLLCPGARGAKGVLQDLDEARKSIVRAIELAQGALVAVPTQFNAPPLCSACHTLHHVGAPCSARALLDTVRAPVVSVVEALGTCPGCYSDPNPHPRTAECTRL